MKRVQLILEEWQQEWLASEAARTSTSMSALLRQLMTEAIEHRQMDKAADDPLWGVIGMAEGPDDGVSSENLDEYLYQLPHGQGTGTMGEFTSPLRKAAESSVPYDVDHR